MDLSILDPIASIDTRLEDPNHKNVISKAIKQRAELMSFQNVYYLSRMKMLTRDPEKIKKVIDRRNQLVIKKSNHARNIMAIKARKTFDAVPICVKENKLFEKILVDKLGPTKTENVEELLFRANLIKQEREHKKMGRSFTVTDKTVDETEDQKSINLSFQSHTHKSIATQPSSTIKLAQSPNATPVVTSTNEVTSAKVIPYGMTEKAQYSSITKQSKQTRLWLNIFTMFASINAMRQSIQNTIATNKYYELVLNPVLVIQRWYQFYKNYKVMKKEYDDQTNIGENISESTKLLYSGIFLKSPPLPITNRIIYSIKRLINSNDEAKKVYHQRTDASNIVIELLKAYSKSFRFKVRLLVKKIIFLQSKVREYMTRCRQDVNKLMLVFDEILPTIEYKAKTVIENKFEEIKIYHNSSGGGKKTKNPHNYNNNSDALLDLFNSHEHHNAKHSTSGTNGHIKKNISKIEKTKEILDFMNKSSFKYYVEEHHGEDLVTLEKRNIKFDKHIKYMTIQHFVSVERRNFIKSEENHLYARLFQQDEFTTVDAQKFLIGKDNQLTRHLEDLRAYYEVKRLKKFVSAMRGLQTKESFYIYDVLTPERFIDLYFDCVEKQIEFLQHHKANKHNHKGIGFINLNHIKNSGNKTSSQYANSSSSPRTASSKSPRSENIVSPRSYSSKSQQLSTENIETQ